MALAAGAFPGLSRTYIPEEAASLANGAFPIPLRVPAGFSVPRPGSFFVLPVLVTKFLSRIMLFIGLAHDSFNGSGGW